MPDIGVDAPRPGSQPSTRRPANPGVQASRAKPAVIVAIVVGVVVVASLLFALIGGGDQRERAVPPPTPESVPDAVPTAAGDTSADLPEPVRPDPTVVTVPIVNDGFTRAGDECRLGLDDDLRNEVTFTVPDGRSMVDCNVLVRDVNAIVPLEALGEIWFVDQPLGHQLNTLRTDTDVTISSGQWSPVNGRRAYHFDLVSDDHLSDWDRLELIEVPGGTVHVRRRDERYASRVGESYDQLVSSIRIDGDDEVPSALPRPGGWCSGEFYVTRVPNGWFADDECGWLNSSSESPTVLQCECLPPLWIEHVSVPLDGDFGVLEPTVDRLSERADGSSIRVLEGLRRDPNNMDRPVRIVVVDGGIERVVVVAAEFPEHVLPGHTWRDTLEAQKQLVDTLRFHSLPTCGPANRWIGTSENPSIQMLVGGEGVSVPSGTAFLGTGCQRTIGSIQQTEVRLEANPTVIGWVDPAELRQPQIAACPSDGRDAFDPSAWDQRIVGDFDGDGRMDEAYVRNLDMTEPAQDVPPNVNVLFAEGGLGSGLFARRSVDGALPFPIVEPARSRRLVGMGRDLLEIVSLDLTATEGTTVVSLFDLVSCELDHDFGWLLANRGDGRSNLCYAIDGQTTVIRSWRSFRDRYQGRVISTNQVWGARDGQLNLRGDRVGSDLCGPDLPELQEPVDPASTDPASALADLTGDHELTLQWISVREETVGAISFDPLGRGRYEVEGRHRGPSGNELRIDGVIERLSDVELVFTGRIETTVSWLNGGEPCVRDAGQRFIARPGTSFWRMQDRINCDGGRTDWIDIGFEILSDEPAG